MADVFFWSRATGVVEFPDAEFTVDVGRTGRRGELVQTEPKVRCRRRPDAILDQIGKRVGCVGLLWTLDDDGEYRNVIPAVLTGVRAEPVISGATPYTVEFEAVGPFVAEGVSRVIMEPYA